MDNLKKLHLLSRNKTWLSSPLGTSQKLKYYPSAALALVRTAMGKQQYIHYLSDKFYYDNFVTPLSLQAYPHEIGVSILANLPSKTRIKSVLDIGGNIGQFSLTMNHFLGGDAVIDVIEPNAEIFEIIQKNTMHKQAITLHNVGVGKPAITQLFYTPGKSGTGSVFKANTTTPSKAKKTQVTLINDIAKLTGRHKYDLVKIDVEGYEYELLKEIKPFSTKFLFLEVSSHGRYKDFTHSDLFDLIKKKFGAFEILHMSPANANSVDFDTLLHFT